VAPPSISFKSDLPRLSVDFDLVYLPVHARSEVLTGINAAMARVADAAQFRIPGVRIASREAEGTILKLIVAAEGVQVKIEISPVLRGTVNPSAVLQISPSVMPKPESFPSRTSMPAIWLLRWTASIPAISSTFAISCAMKGSCRHW